LLDIFFKFTYPYVTSLIGAAYNVQQSLEGAGLGSSNFLVTDNAGRIVDSYWSPTEAMALPFAVLLMYTLLLSLGYCVAGFAISRRKGFAIALASLLLPGLISSFGYWPSINFVPEVYHIGGVGSLGSPYGIAALVIIALLTGWTCVVIATDVLSLQDRFRHLYDHLWYSMAILGGLFFVADAGTSQEVRDLQDTTKQVQQASSFLLAQVRDYERRCKSDSRALNASCVWATQVRQKLLDYSIDDERLYWQFGPKTEGDLYSLQSEKGDQGAEIQNELMQFNKLQCWSSSSEVSQSKSDCERTPPKYCIGTSDVNYIVRPVAIANECVIPTLVALRAKMEKQVMQVGVAARTKHLRWLFYILFAILAGGKVANATAKLTKIKSGEFGLGDQRNTLRLVNLALWLLQGAVKLARDLINRIFLLVRHITQLIALLPRKVWQGNK